MSSTDSLTEAQKAALVGLQVGDLLFIQKLAAPVYESDSEDEDYDEDDDRDDDDQDQDEDAEMSGDGGDDENEGDDEDASESESGGDESDEQSGGSSSATSTETPVLPRIFVISAISQDAEGNATDVQLTHLTYSSTVSDSTKHSYHIYGKRVVHHHPTSCGDCATSSTPINEVITKNDYHIYAKPDGDYVRRLDQDVCAQTTQKRCITGCNKGFLDANQAPSLDTMIANYTSPTTSTGIPVPGSFQAAICPVCVGDDLLNQQQTLQATMMLLPGSVPIDDILDFLHLLNPRRTELGYRFRQFDEREWGYGGFSDMLSEDEDDGQGQGGGNGQFEHWDEALDPNASIHHKHHPASDATIAALPRKTYKDVKNNEGMQHCCVFDSDELKDEDTLVELPCEHVYWHEECITQWLKQFDTCPTCRHKVA